MLSYLEGTVKYIFVKSLILICNNFGLEIFVNDIKSFKQGETASLFLYYHVKDDERAYYGFKTVEEKLFFMLLISINGVGPKTAMSILSVGNIQNVAWAIKNKNIKYLKSLPSVGTRLAQQLVISLFDKIDNRFLSKEDDNTSISYDALINLGFTRDEVIYCLNSIDRSNFKTDEEYISRCLKFLSR